MISAIDNKNNKRRRNAIKKKAKKQRQKRTSGTEAIVKEWELNNFVVRLSQVFSN